jgi:hypothetical protein
VVLAGSPAIALAFFDWLSQQAPNWSCETSWCPSESKSTTLRHVADPMRFGGGGRGAGLVGEIDWGGGGGCWECAALPGAGCERL